MPSTPCTSAAKYTRGLGQCNSRKQTHERPQLRSNGITGKVEYWPEPYRLADKSLLRGEVRAFQVSPDNTKIAVVANGRLLVVDSEKPTVREVAPVDSIYRDPKPMGQYFYRDQDFQWSEDSRYLYLIRDEFYDSKGSQLFSNKGELWNYDVQTGDLHLVLKPFPAYTYFFGRNGGIYLSVPTERGDLQLKYFDGHHVTDVGTPNTSSISPDQLSANSVESPFFSFSIVDYQRTVIAEKEVEKGLRRIRKDRGSSFKKQLQCSHGKGSFTSLKEIVGGASRIRTDE